MVKMKIICTMIPFLIIGSLFIGCTAPNPVNGIVVRKALPSHHPPGGSFVGLKNPHPTEVQAVFQRGDKMVVLLSISKKLKSEVTFTRYTFFNKETGQEVDIGSPEDFAAWEPGQVDWINLGNPWAVPEQSGEYEVRVYMNENVVASALFNVGIWPVSWGPEMIKRPAPIYEVRVITGPQEPPWLDVVVYIKGGLPQGCEASYGWSVEQAIDDTIYIEVTIRHLKDVPCEDYVYFEETFNLRPSLLKNFTPGETYKVDVNGNITTFIMP